MPPTPAAPAVRAAPGAGAASGAVSEAASAPSGLLPPAARARRALGLVLGVLALVAVAAASLALGVRAVPPAVVWEALTAADPASEDQIVVRDLRVPRTLLGLAVGAALGVAGALLQALTRNPLGDPGLLGVNAGAAAAVVAGLALGVAGRGSTLLALGGAALAMLVVTALGAVGRSATAPVRLALAGVAVTAVLQSLVTAVTLADRATFDAWRLWAVGSLAARGWEPLADAAPFLLAGAVLAAVLARPLDALALGEDLGRALGARVATTRVLTVVAVTLLCGAGTAAVGPIAFVGLAAPHAARLLVGPAQRWLLPYAAVLGALLLVAADVLGRLLARPGELQVGVLTAAVGAPVLVALVRRGRVGGLR
ncbi:iron ABC transporter permease [Quadrisphaera sp. DSM 44207]|uniref:FecCD family ABC transporter permease n=1 Tax=Quadrisphaera sp. DSM 44207 TaxID=1881057 RepID=UPI000889AA9C|nr:iron ABC transporter permease [Quadrisphaera sp. DSM 44207]SDQ87088.1 iron complex transport system permease protein [Quadrisphaera sp. DSM 44207]